MMHDVRFPFYDTESGRLVVYKEKVYRFNFVGYMTFKNREGLNPLSPDTLAAYLEQLEPERKDVGQLMIEAGAYEYEKQEQRKREQRREELIKNYQADYENACDDLYYGYGFKFWYNAYGVKDRLSEDDARTLWRAAVLKMSQTA